MPSPILGWSQVPPVGYRAIGAGAPVFGSPQLSQTVPGLPAPRTSPAGTLSPIDVYGFGAGTMGFAQPAFASPGLAGGFQGGFGPFAFAGPLSGFVAPDIATHFSLPAFLAAVAVKRGQPMGPTNDQEVEDFLYDVLELIPGAGEVEVRCEAGRATLSGSVQHKRLKRDVGEIAWSIPGINDVQNNVTIATRRRSRSGARETEHAGAAGRKQA